MLKKQKEVLVKIEALTYPEAAMAACQQFTAAILQVYEEGKGLIAADIERILEGLYFASFKHRMQVRHDKAKTPYIIHVIGVATQLMRIGQIYDVDILLAALLHDTIEDTETTFTEIEQHFGKRVESFVRELTDDKTLPKEERKRLQILHAKETSAGGAQIKLSDKLYNLLDLIHNPPKGWKSDRIDAYFKWSEQVVNHLPWVNAGLKHAVDEVIQDYYKDYRKKLFGVL